MSEIILAYRKIFSIREQKKARTRTEPGRVWPHKIHRGGEMEKIKIEIMVKVDGNWVPLDSLPEEERRRIVRESVTNAGNNAGFNVKTA